MPDPDDAARLDVDGATERILDAIGVTAGRVTACPDCDVPPGQAHEDGCDVARCLATGRQRLMCGRQADHPGAFCGQDVWTGQWPGENECREYGFVLTAGLVGGRIIPDLNRLFAECRWDRGQGRWVLRDLPVPAGDRVTFEQAVAMLPPGERIHTFLEPPGKTAGGLLGASWTRDGVLNALRQGAIRRAGRNATKNGHGLVVFRPGRLPVFIQTADHTTTEGTSQP
jgi:hypothetical protein